MTSRAYINGFPIFIFIIWQLPKPKIFSRSSTIRLPQRQAITLLSPAWHNISATAVVLTLASHGKSRTTTATVSTHRDQFGSHRSSVVSCECIIYKSKRLPLTHPHLLAGVQQYLHTEMNWNVGLSDEPRVDVLPSAARQEDRSLARDQQLRMKILKWSKFYWCIKIKLGGDLLGPRWRFWRYTVTSGPKDRLQFSVALTCLWLCCLKCLQFLKLRHVFRNLMRSERQLNFEGNTCCFAVVPI